MNTLLHEQDVNARETEMNAQWWVYCKVTSPGGSERMECVSLASPDLQDTREAKRRAMKTGETRLLKRLRKQWGESGHLVKVRAVNVRCVG